MKKSELRNLIREEIKRVLKENNLKPGFKGYDMNDYALTVVAGPFMSTKDLGNIIKTKFSKANDILRDKNLMDELNDTNATEVGGFYLVQGPDYGGSGYSVVNGEDISKALEEVSTSGRYYYIYFNGKDAIQGDPMETKKDITKLGMEPDDVKNVGPVYEIQTGSYTIYVITSMKNKKDVWCVANPGDPRFADDDEFSYKLCMKAIDLAKSGKGKRMTFADYLKS
jgi:hypothetical protein